MELLAQVRLDRRLPLGEQVYSLLRGMIVTGRINPGDTIDDKEISAALAISRTPVREAIKRLSDEHLVDVIAQSGTRASRINRQELQQAFLIRRALEMESAAQAAPRMTQVHSDALSELLLIHARAIEARNYDKAIATDDAFHRYIAEVSNLPRLWRTVEISKAQLDRCRHKMLPLAGEGEATLDHHRRIIRALNSRDPERARLAMAQHLELAFTTTVKVLDGEEQAVA
jgi:DNA-binding GntR family transcriptional regulator